MKRPADRNDPSNDRPDGARRLLLQGAGAAVALSLLPFETPAQQAPTIPALAQFLAGRSPRWERLHLELPPLADNGQAVPIKLLMSGPFAQGAAVKAIHLFSEINPVPEMAVFEFPSPPPRVEIDSRVRLAGSQKVVAVAVLEDGSLYAAGSEVVVTIAACFDES